MQVTKIYKLSRSMVGLFTILILIVCNVHAEWRTETCNLYENRLLDIYNTSKKIGSKVAPEIKFFINVDDLSTVKPKDIISTFGGITQNIKISDGYIDFINGKNNKFVSYGTDSNTINLFDTDWKMRDIEQQDLDDMATRGVIISAEKSEKFAKNHRFIDGWIPDDPDAMGSREMVMHTVKISGIFTCTRLLSKDQERSKEGKELKCEPGNNSQGKKSDKPCSVM